MLTLFKQKSGLSLSQNNFNSRPNTNHSNIASSVNKPYFSNDITIALMGDVSKIQEILFNTLKQTPIPYGGYHNRLIFPSCKQSRISLSIMKPAQSTTNYNISLILEPLLPRHTLEPIDPFNSIDLSTPTETIIAFLIPYEDDRDIDLFRDAVRTYAQFTHNEKILYKPVLMTEPQDAYCLASKILFRGCYPMSRNRGDRFIHVTDIPSSPEAGLAFIANVVSLCSQLNGADNMISSKTCLSSWTNKLERLGYHLSTTNTKPSFRVG